MYFSKFPNMLYDVTGNGNVKLVTNLLRRVKVRSKVRDKFRPINGCASKF